ncbi:MAG: M13 family metallopeptidase [Pseudobacteriovorax sp.]|nr:M13 family metallopeptidase [Pseudobacteriovorax sp.]
MQIKHMLLLGASLPCFASSKIPEVREFPVNPNINPCENFYEHSCSKVNESFTLRDDRSRHAFAFNDSAERLLQKKKEFLQGLPMAKTLPGFQRTLRNAYMACTNLTARQKEEKDLVASTISTVANLKDRKAFLDYLAKERDESRFSFVGVGAIPSKDNPDIQDFVFLMNFMSLPERSYYSNEPVVKAFQENLTEFFRIVGDKSPKATAKAVFDLEKNYADIYPIPAEMRKIWSMKTSISRDDLLAKYPSFRLDVDLRKVPKKTNITHMVPDVFAYTEKLLQTADLQTLKATYLYHALSSIMDTAYPEFFAKEFDFSHKYLGGAKARSSLEERCTRDIMRTYRKEIDAELVDVIFPDFPEEKFIALAEKVRGAIIKGIEENTWLSEKGKKGAILKTKSAGLMLVKPRNEAEWYFNPKVTLKPNKYIGNKIALGKAIRARMFEEIGKPRDKTRWYMGPLTVNAYYAPSDNLFVMPLGILQPPFYDPKEPDVVNFGAVGAVIGHELGHGIDDNGAKYDHKGRLNQWMPDEDIAEFTRRGQALIAQWDKAGHNGKLTLGENIGDLTGVSFAYSAAFPDGKGSIEDKQRFFLQYARVWCYVARPKDDERRLKTGPHSLPWARVNEQVKHQTGFQEAFSCKQGDAMFLPEKDRIRIW